MEIRMNRRSIIQGLVALIGSPSGITRGVSPTQTVGMTELDLGPFPGEVPPQNPWLERWLRIPMHPIVSSLDLEDCREIHDRDLGLEILARRDGAEPLVFRYDGGSNPGAIRSVHPVLLFRKFDHDLSVGAKEMDSTGSPVYLLAHCLKRKAPRTFRLDRMKAHL